MDDVLDQVRDAVEAPIVRAPRPAAPPAFR
jgi:hypothetical protein